MTVTKAKAENKSIEWATPQALFDVLNAEFRFTLDPCATIANAKCEKFYTKEDDGLAHSWAGERVWMNPPYGKELSAWVEKAATEGSNPGTTVVAIFPPRTDARWFHQWVAEAYEIRLLQGRIHFENPENPANRPQDPSCIAIFNDSRQQPGIRWLRFWDWKTNTYR